MIAAPPPPPPPLVIVFRGSYTLNAHATQATFAGRGSDCVPGVIQRERELVRWEIRFAKVRLPANGTVTVAAESVTVSGGHTWDEASAACGPFRAGVLHCRSHFARGRPALEIDVRGGIPTFHPQLEFVSVSDGCRGEVFNEHPDCGARDAVDVLDFAFRSDLAQRAPRLARGESVASFDVRRTRTCSKRGVRNSQMIRQNALSRYRGSFEVRPRAPRATERIR